MASVVAAAGGRRRSRYLARMSRGHDGAPGYQARWGARVASAYDAVAADYDRELRRARWARRVLWHHFSRLFRRGDRVLDVGCGTGSDTIRLASRGIHVTAIDVSDGMMRQMRAKVAAASLDAFVDAYTGEVVDVLRSLGGPFDGVVSSFAVLNTVDLRSFEAEAERLLRPGGRLVAHLLAPPGRAHHVWWRTGRDALRAPGPDAIEVEVDIHGHPVAHRLFGCDDLYRRFFAAAFSRRRAFALNLLVALTTAGRFYVLDLERRVGAAASVTPS
jgi:SAM-dependent methyltransferase